MRYTTRDRLARLFDDNPKIANRIIRMKMSWDEVARLLNAENKPRKKK